MEKETLKVSRTEARTTYARVKQGDNPEQLLEELFGKKNLLPINECITMWQDVLDYHNETEAEFEKRCIGLEPDEVGYRMCKMWCAALNEEWKPDFADGSQPKYHVWMKYEVGSGFSFYDCVTHGLCSCVGSRLVLRSRQLAEHYGKYAVPAINKFFL